MTTSLLDSIIYGPVHSRRFGSSLGINLSGSAKHCTFDCLYCFRGPNEPARIASAPVHRLPRPDEVLVALERWLYTSANVDSIADWTFAGNAEPTVHPDFPNIVAKVIELRDRLYPQVKVTVLTNGTGLVPRMCHHHADVRTALTLVDRPCLKLDAGTESLFLRLSRPQAHLSLNEWMQAVKSLPSVCLQTMLVQGTVDNTTDDELSALGSAYLRLGPRLIYLLSIDKTPTDPGLCAVPPERLFQIRAQFDALFVAATIKPEIIVAA